MTTALAAIATLKYWLIELVWWIVLFVGLQMLWRAAWRIYRFNVEGYKRRRPRPPGHVFNLRHNGHLACRATIRLVEDDRLELVSIYWLNTKVANFDAAGRYRCGGCHEVFDPMTAAKLAILAGDRVDQEGGGFSPANVVGDRETCQAVDLAERIKAPGDVL